MLVATLQPSSNMSSDLVESDKMLFSVDASVVTAVEAKRLFSGRVRPDKGLFSVDDAVVLADELLSADVDFVIVVCVVIELTNGCAPLLFVATQFGHSILV